MSTAMGTWGYIPHKHRDLGLKKVLTGPFSAILYIGKSGKTLDHQCGRDNCHAYVVKNDQIYMKVSPQRIAIVLMLQKTAIFA